MSGTPPKSHSKTQKVTLITLGVITVVTVFFLPQFVTEPWWTTETDGELALPPPAPDEVAPSTAAELKRYRPGQKLISNRRSEKLKREIKSTASATTRNLLLIIVKHETNSLTLWRLAIRNF
jgi:hypothetical protein